MILFVCVFVYACVSVISILPIACILNKPLVKSKLITFERIYFCDLLTGNNAAVFRCPIQAVLLLFQWDSMDVELRGKLISLELIKGFIQCFSLSKCVDNNCLTCRACYITATDLVSVRRQRDDAAHGSPQKIISVII